MSWPTLGLFTALGLLVGLVLARVAARGRRIRLRRELARAEADAASFARFEAALRAFPFGEGVPAVQDAIRSARIERERCRLIAARCRKALGEDRVRA